ncbi:uncharacterized protein P174DRAFT_370158, partial [Aspergillus novofumigatus IBT 16806]
GGVLSPTHDICLGNIVVSMPDSSSGGVVQYDLGKDEEDGFSLNGFLWPHLASSKSRGLFNLATIITVRCFQGKCARCTRCSTLRRDSDAE